VLGLGEILRTSDGDFRCWGKCLRGANILHSTMSIRLPTAQTTHVPTDRNIYLSGSAGNEHERNFISSVHSFRCTLNVLRVST